MKILQYLQGLRLVLVFNILWHTIQAGLLLFYASWLLNRYSIKRPLSSTARDLFRLIGVVNISFILLAMVALMADERTKGFLLLVFAIVNFSQFVLNVKFSQSIRWKSEVYEVGFFNAVMAILNGFYFILYYS